MNWNQVELEEKYDEEEAWLLKHEHVNQLFVLKVDPTNEDLKVRKPYMIGVLSDTYEYHYFVFNYRYNKITKSFIDNATDLFLRLNITRTTTICYNNDNILTKDAIYLFLYTLQKQKKFDLISTNLDNVMSCIVYFHPEVNRKRKPICKDLYTCIYKKLLKYEHCLWINPETNIKDSVMLAGDYRKQRFLKLCMYYLCIRKFKFDLYNKNFNNGSPQ